MNVPGWWQFTLLALGSYRLTRLIGWDDLPPIARARAWLTGESSEWSATSQQMNYRYRRPLLAHFIACPFCVGFWLSLGSYLAWLAWPGATLYAMTPLALSAVVGLISKQLDP